MEACKSRDVSSPNEFNDPSVASVEIEENAMAAAFADFSFASYRKYISSEEEPTYNEEMDPLRNRFAMIAGERDKDIHEMDVKITALREEGVVLESGGLTIEDLKKRNHDLTRDGAKFRNYCQEKRKRKLEQQKAEIEEKLKEKNVSLATSESLAKEHEAEKKRCAEPTAHLETRWLAYNQKMETLVALKDRVRKQIDKFNANVKRLFPAGQEQHELLLVYNPGAATANEMFFNDVDQKLIPMLERSEIIETQDFNQITMETQRLRDKTDALNTDIEQTKLDL